MSIASIDKIQPKTSLQDSEHNFAALEGDVHILESFEILAAIGTILTVIEVIKTNDKMTFAALTLISALSVIVFDLSQRHRREIAKTKGIKIKDTFCSKIINKAKFWQLSK